MSNWLLQEAIEGEKDEDSELDEDFIPKSEDDDSPGDSDSSTSEELGDDEDNERETSEEEKEGGENQKEEASAMKSDSLVAQPELIDENTFTVSPKRKGSSSLLQKLPKRSLSQFKDVPVFSDRFNSFHEAQTAEIIRLQLLAANLKSKNLLITKEITDLKKPVELRREQLKMLNQENADFRKYLQTVRQDLVPVLSGLAKRSGVEDIVTTDNIGSLVGELHQRLGSSDEIP